MLDVKTYTTKEAKAEWDRMREGRRRMVLARVEMRESPVAYSDWNDIDASDKKLVHQALNEDFFAPTWYINAKGIRVDRIAIPVIEKSQEQMNYEEGEAFWNDIGPFDRHSALLANGIGADAEQAKYSPWSRLSPALRDKLVTHFRAKIDQCAQAANTVQMVHRKPIDPRQLALF